jgi:hypothetical protein
VDLDGHWPEFASSRELAAKKYTTRAGKGRPVELLQVYELLKNLKGRLICKEEIGYLVIEPDGTYEHFTTTAPLKDFLVGLQDCYKSGGHQ